MTLVLSLAVAAGPVKLSEVAGIEVGDGDSAGAIVLDDLVFSVERATADDVGNISGASLEESQRICSDGGSPY